MSPSTKKNVRELNDGITVGTTNLVYYIFEDSPENGDFRVHMCVEFALQKSNLSVLIHFGKELQRDQVLKD